MTTDHDAFPLPDLRFVPVETLVPHEQHDAHRMEALARKLREEPELKNPPVVSPLGPQTGSESRFVVLDGANRATAAREAGFPHMLVQVVPYEEPYVRLTTWYHALADLEPHDLQQELARIPGLTCHTEERIHGRALLARREALACVVSDFAAVITLTGGADLEQRNALLNAIVDIYRHRTFYRVPTDSLAAARVRHKDATVMVVFPHFEPDEILELAMSGARLPAGITRHLIRWRALRVNLPIERLSDRKATIDEKNRWLGAWLAERTATRHVRFYEESTVLFDE